MYINKAFIYGNITKDVELKTLPSNGQSVVNFSIATNKTWKDKSGEKQEQSEFHNIVVYGKTAELISQYCKKGDPIYIEGSIQTRSWDKDGVKMYKTEIITENFQFGTKLNKQSPVVENEDSDNIDF